MLDGGHHISALKSLCLKDKKDEKDTKLLVRVCKSPASIVESTHLNLMNDIANVCDFHSFLFFMLISSFFGFGDLDFPLSASKENFSGLSK